jgi:hypothetical protein
MLADSMNRQLPHRMIKAIETCPFLGETDQDKRGFPSKL